jgi:hypothetical protein
MLAKVTKTLYSQKVNVLLFNLYEIRLRREDKKLVLWVCYITSPLKIFKACILSTHTRIKVLQIRQMQLNSSNTNKAKTI